VLLGHIIRLRPWLVSPDPADLDIVCCVGKGSRIRAERERRNEAHASLVAERAGNPDFAQRQRTADGYTYTMDPRTADAIDGQLRSFREKFGRDPGPDDPLIFDPDADEPVPLSETAMMAQMRRAVTAAGLDPAIADAYDELGYLLTEMNRHLFSVEDIQAWESAVTRARERRRG
jgi:hypothetical protein